MSQPEGGLTPAQHEILEAVWDHGATGATVAEIWQVISAKRPVQRTTVLNQVDRLEKRGWLLRRHGDTAHRYFAVVSREQAAAWLAGSFVDDFFDGSASNLVLSLLGSSKLSPDDVARLRKALDSAAESPDTPKEPTR